MGRMPSSTRPLARAFAAAAAGAPLAPVELELGELGPTSVLIRISHCGVCGTDLSLIGNKLGNATFPLIPGHEIVGEVEAVGAQVESLAVGTRVGVGWYRAACFACASCARGQYNTCPGRVRTCVGNPGGFATHIAVDHRLAFEIPEAIDSAAAGPLLCAGATVYAPLAYWERPRVGVVGVGGLGHLGIQFAAAMGAEVTAISASADKEADARRYGAGAFWPVTELAAHRGEIDLLLFTSGAVGDLAPYIELLAPRGVLCMLTLPPGKIDVPVGLLIRDLRVIAGSNTASRDEIREMLQLAARANVRPEVELYDFDRVNDAVDRVSSGAVRYRAVLRWG